MTQEEAAMRLGIEEGLVLSVGELEVSIDVSGLTKSQVKNLPVRIVSDRSEHFRFKR